MAVAKAIPPAAVEPSRRDTMKREKAYRGFFLAAGAYNILWGIYAVIDPQWFFRLTGLPQSNTPQMFATLGVVLGLYGISTSTWLAARPMAGWWPRSRSPARSSARSAWRG
jgi:hypothetical protein